MGIATKKVYPFEKQSQKSKSEQFTCGRPYRKNRSSHVEQKNYTAVRRYTAYFRYDTEEELELLNRLYDVLCPYLNFFQPQMKLQEKIRVGSKVIKRYDKPKTPYERLIESPNVDEVTKKKLKRKSKKLNPSKLLREINHIQMELYKRSNFKAFKRS